MRSTGRRLVEGRRCLVDRIAAMRLRRAARVPLSWIAILAIVASALAPAISHALSGSRSQSWVEVCTSLGSKWISADAVGDELAPDPLDELAFSHCVYCSLQANSPGLPPSPVADAAVRREKSPRPESSSATPGTAQGWHRAQPRAPPAVS